MKLFILAAFMMIAASLQSQEDLPTQYVEADTNGDGFIEISEVQRMIDGFFISTHDHGVMYIHNLIDYFFEQPFNENIEGM